MNFRPMTRADSQAVLAMMRVFYRSPAVLSDGSEEIFAADIENCVGDLPYLEGWIFDSDGTIAGYSMLAKSYSTEFGKPCIWIEDLYVTPEFQGRGIGSQYLDFVAKRYADAAIRLEVEQENLRAVHVYEKGGFEVLPYLEMIRK